MLTFKDLILKDPDKIKLKDETGTVHIFEVVDPTEEEIEQDSDTPVCSDNLNKMQTVQQVTTTLNSAVNANVDYILPQQIYYRVRRQFVRSILL